MMGMAEATLAEGEDLGRPHGKNVGDALTAPRGETLRHPARTSRTRPTSLPRRGPVRPACPRRSPARLLPRRQHRDPPANRCSRWSARLVGLAPRLSAFCSPGPVLKCSARSSQIATSGVTCGRPSRRTVAIENSCASRSTRSVSPQGVGSAPGSLKRSSSSVITSPIVSSSGLFLASHRFRGRLAVMRLRSRSGSASTERRYGGVGRTMG